MGIKDIWPYIREKFPPARAVALLTPIVIPILGYFNAWVADHAPWVDQYVASGQRQAIVIGTVVGGVALAYKWLDGRAKWEAKQIDAHLALSAKGHISTPDDPDHLAGLDEDALLSQPDDIAESDGEDPAELVKRERVELDTAQ